jgi:2-dehydropantoate 2-reductase
MSQVVVVGGGGIGGVVAARLALAGRLPCIVTQNPNITEAVARDGMQMIDTDGRAHVAKPACVTHMADLPHIPVSHVLYAVPPNRLDEAVDAALHKSPAGLVHAKTIHVPLCNGLPEERIAARVSLVVGGVVAFGANMLAPGRVEQTSGGDIQLGALAGSSDSDKHVAATLEALAGLPVTRTDNLRGTRWSKLAANCAISTLGTLGADRVGVLLRHRFVRRLALEIFTEVFAVAAAHGVKMEKAGGVVDLEWLTLDDEERRSELGSPSLFAKHTLLLAASAKYRRLKSSMLLGMQHRSIS